MQLKRYEAPTIQDAFKKIKSELGTHAVIFDTRIKNHKQMPGNDKQKRQQWVEVLAAVDRETSTPDQKTFCTGTTLPDIKKHDTPGYGLRKQVRNGCLYDCVNSVPYNNTITSFSELFFPAYTSFVNNGFRDDIAYYLAHKACCRADKPPLSEKDIKKLLIGTICDQVQKKTYSGMQRKRIIAFAGPSGVGKTTTLLKYAVHHATQQTTSLHMITTDTNKIGVSEQIKIYGNLLGVPVSTATHDTILQHIQESDAQILLVDTAALHCKYGDVTGELAWTDTMDDIEVNLLLCSAYSQQVIESTVEAYSKHRVDSVIMTKIDESVGIGGVFGTIISKQLPVSCMTTGHRIPEDIQEVTSVNLNNLLEEYFL